MEKNHYKRFIDEDVVGKVLVEAGFDKTSKNAIMANIRNLSVTNKYADEEVKSNRGYPPGYKPKKIAEQIKTLRKFFPGLGTADESIAEKPLPAGAEGWFAIPRYKLVGTNYNEAVEKMFKAGYNDRAYNWSDKYLYQEERSKWFWKKLGEEQEGHDILIVPCQLGLRHRGRSIRRALIIMNSSEFGLGVFAVGIMLLTHPERVAYVGYHDNALDIQCAGDSRPDICTGSDFYGTSECLENAPCFVNSFKGVYLNYSLLDDVEKGAGSASGFLLSK